MKIAVIVPSRHRPQSLQASIIAMDALASGRNEIAFTVSYCRDDEQTRQAVFKLPARINAKVHCRTDHCVPGQAFNEAVAATSADAYVGWCDDVFPLTQGWDLLVSGAMQRLSSACWIEANDRENTSYIFSQARVVKALGQLCPEYFPFWFTDMWLAEIHHFAFGHRPYRVDGLFLGGRRGETQGHHECVFWARLFAHTRPERIALAHKLAREFGKLMPDGGPILRMCQAWDADFQSKCAGFDARFGERQKPEAFYERAKAKAIAMMADVAA